MAALDLRRIYVIVEETEQREGMLLRLLDEVLWNSRACCTPTLPYNITLSPIGG